MKYGETLYQCVGSCQPCSHLTGNQVLRKPHTIVSGLANHTPIEQVDECRETLYWCQALWNMFRFRLERPCTIVSCFVNDFPMKQVNKCQETSYHCVGACQPCSPRTGECKRCPLGRQSCGVCYKCMIVWHAQSESKGDESHVLRWLHW